MVVPDPLRAGQDWVKLLDFGIAKLGKPPSLDENGEQTSDTARGTVMGTPVYMAPEQHSDAGVVDGMADVFSFGVMLYEMLAGKRPYKDSALSLISTPAVPMETLRPDTPPQLSALLKRMIALRPPDRPAMAEVEAQLSALLLSLQKRQRSRPLLIALALLPVLLAASGFIAYRVLHLPSLAESRERALKVVKRSLSAAELQEGLQATQALGKSRDIEYRPILEPLLVEQRPAVAAAAARGLGEMSAIESEPLLLALLQKTTHNEVRMEAASALARLSHPRGATTLRSLLEQGDDFTKLEAALRLLEQSDLTGGPLLHKIIDRDNVPLERALPVLLALSRAGDLSARQRLAQLFSDSVSAGKAEPLLTFGLARLGDTAAYQRLHELASQKGPEQIAAARYLAALGQSEGYPLLLQTGADGTLPERLRELAFDGLGDAGRTDAAGVLARTLGESALTARLRLSAAGSILQLAGGSVGENASRSQRWARAALGSDSSATRELAVMLLGDLPEEDTIGLLRTALTDREPAVRSGAARALGRKKVLVALPALVSALDDSEEDVRTVAMKSMGQVVTTLRSQGERSFEAEATARLQLMLEKGTAVDRIVAAGTLLRMGDPSHRALLVEGLRAADALMRRLAVELLDTDAAGFLEALKDADRQVRFAAARRLAALGRLECIEVLRAILSEGGLDGLTAYGLLKKLGEAVSPPPNLALLFAGRPLREKEAVLDGIAELPQPIALEVLLAAASDASSMIRRRAAEVAFDLYGRFSQSAFRSLLLELRNDADVLVRSRVAELIAKLPAVAPSLQNGVPPLTHRIPTAAASPPTPAEKPASPVVVPKPSEPPVKPAPALKTPPRPKLPVKPAVAAPPKKDDPRAKTMGLIQIYVLKNGRCQLTSQYYLPPGDHIINVDGGQSRTVSVYAGTVVPIKQCQ